MPELTFYGFSDASRLMDAFGNPPVNIQLFLLDNSGVVTNVGGSLR